MSRSFTSAYLIKIILRFFVVYALLFAAYRLVILRSRPDFFTLQTARQTDLLYRATGHQTTWKVLPDGARVGIFDNGRWILNIIEGCNSVSILILFLAFVWAFPAPWKERLWFSGAGSALIWITNLLRLWVLGLVYAYRYSWFDPMHRVFFPAAIYGMVVLLWIIWVRRMMRRGVV